MCGVVKYASQQDWQVTISMLNQANGIGTNQKLLNVTLYFF
jgi:hypothetical protein